MCSDCNRRLVTKLEEAAKPAVRRLLPWSAEHAWPTVTADEAAAIYCPIRVTHFCNDTAFSTFSAATHTRQFGARNPFRRGELINYTIYKAIGVVNSITAVPSAAGSRAAGG